MLMSKDEILDSYEYDEHKVYNKPVEFCEWRKWPHNGVFAADEKCNLDESGIYIIAHFDKVPPSGTPDILCKDVIYVGETGDSFAKRLHAFHLSAFEEKDGHSGGNSYRKVFDLDMLAQLHFTIAPVKICLSNKEDKISTKILEKYSDSHRKWVEKAIINEILISRNLLNSHSAALDAEYS